MEIAIIPLESANVSKDFPEWIARLFIAKIIALQKAFALMGNAIAKRATQGNFVKKVNFL